MSNVNAHPVTKTAIFLQIDGISCASIYDAVYSSRANSHASISLIRCIFERFTISAHEFPLGQRF